MPEASRVPPSLTGPAFRAKSSCADRFPAPEAQAPYNPSTESMVLELLSPQTKATQESLQKELVLMQTRFPDANKKVLQRFLMGFGVSADMAIPAYEAHLKWREETLPISKESMLDELRSGRFYFHGKDKEGRPIAYYSLANHNPSNRNLDSIFRMMAYLIEGVLDDVDEQADVTAGFTIVWDTRNTGMKNTDNEFLKGLFSFFRAEYPEVLCRMLIAPVGVLQRGVWKVARRFLDERRASRIKMLPRMSALLKYIDEDQLLHTHGGKNPWSFDPTLI